MKINKPIPSEIIDKSKVEDEPSSQSPLLSTFERYLNLNYSNKTTRYIYYCLARKFIKDWTIKNGSIPTELTQDMLDGYVIALNASVKQNPSYKGFIHAFRRCFDPQERNLWLNTKLDRSRQRTEVEERTEYLPHDSYIEIVEKTSPQISLMVDFIFETSGRKGEFLNFDLTDNTTYSIDPDKCCMRTLGKGNKLLIRTFSKRLAERYKQWIKSPECINPDKPFILYTSSGEPYKNQGSAFWKRLRKEANFLHIRLPSGRNIFPHSIRHGSAHFLMNEAGWDLTQTMTKLGHSSPVHTVRYAKPTREEIEKKEKELPGWS